MPTTTNEVSDEVHAAFDWWASLDTPPTRNTNVDDWVVSSFRDAICFTRPAEYPNAWLVRDRTVVNFGFDHDTLESAYGMLPRVTQLASTVRTRRP